MDKQELPPEQRRHQWECISPGEYDFLYECKGCGKRHMESIDNPGSEPPEFGCSAKQTPDN